MKFKKVEKTVSGIAKNDITVSTTFSVTPINGLENAWIASIQQTQFFDDKSKQVIGAECFDKDVLKAMDKAQTQFFSTGLDMSTWKLGDDTDLLWNEITEELEKQFGFFLG